MFLTSCDACGFECDACYVDGAWQFLCALCARVEAFELDAIVSRAESRTNTRTVEMDAHGYIVEKMAAFVAFEGQMAACRALLASIETMTARVSK